MSGFKQGMDAARAIAAEHGIDVGELRSFASQHLQQDGWPEGHGISSSDVSHHLAELARSQPELLTAEAERLQERNAMVAKVAAHTGKTQAETLDALRRLLATDD